MPESKKWDFAKSKLKKPEIFAGYLPLIRNAVSHAGTHSIVYEEERVVFRKIERSETPKILKVVKIPNAELWGKLRSMLDLIVAMNAAIEIFALDTSDDIFSDETIKSAFMRILQPTNCTNDGRQTKRQNIELYGKALNLQSRRKLITSLKSLLMPAVGS